MYIIKDKSFIGMFVLLIVIALAPAAISAAPADDNRPPELPSPLCDQVNVPEGSRLQFRAFATGVQVYRWDGSAWLFVQPVANLFANVDYTGQIGTHYAGPTWESTSGSKVVGTRLFGCQPDPTAIPWLRLEAVSTSGPGIFNSVTFIQRLNTTGGLAPSTPGLVVGQTAEVPYTAEYYFYRD